MKISFSLSFLLAFLSMVFLIQELHDWAHVLTASWLCGCLGTKTFDNWTFCDHCEISGNVLVLVWWAGPAINYGLMWIAWSLMSRRNEGATRSFGFTLFFAANPLPNILAALVGGGDITLSMKMLYLHPDGKNHFFVSIASLLLIVGLTIFPLMKAMAMLKSKPEKFILTPVFLLLPVFFIKTIVSYGMNFVLKQGFFDEDIFTGTPLLVLIWFFVIALLLLLNQKSLSNFIRKKEKRSSLRM